MKKDRLLLFEDGLVKCRTLMIGYPDSAALRSIENQIKFLIELEVGKSSDFKRIREINIGVLTAREVGVLDGDAAELFYKIASEARLM